MSKIKHTSSFEISQSSEILFPLFSAEGEKLWVPGWDYENIMGTTELHEDYIFVTKNHDHGSTDAIWLVKKHDPQNYFVQYYKVEPEDKVGIISVLCKKIDKFKTNVEVTYEYVGLSEKGDEFIKNSHLQNTKNLSANGIFYSLNTSMKSANKLINADGKYVCAKLKRKI